MCFSRYGILEEATQNRAVRNTSNPAVQLILISNQLKQYSTEKITLTIGDVNIHRNFGEDGIVQSSRGKIHQQVEIHLDPVLASDLVQLPLITIPSSGFMLIWVFVSLQM